MEAQRFFSYEDIHLTVRALAAKIEASGFEPDLMVAIGTGGFIPARILKTYLRLPILTVGLQLYGDDNKPAEAPRKIQWIDEAESKIADRRVLLVDEVDDTRLTLEYCIRELLSHGPAEIAVGVLHNKRKPKRGAYPPEVARVFSGQEIDDVWVRYPWDAADIAAHEAAARAQAGTAIGSRLA